MDYYWVKLIHILSSTLLFGTGMGTAFYMLKAHLSKDTVVIAYTTRQVVLADWLFTTPAVIIQPLTGIWLMMRMQYEFSAHWIALSLALFVLIGVCWLPVVWIQIKIRNLAEKALDLKIDVYTDKQYQRWFKIWFILGWPAFIAVIIIFYLMVFKP